MDKDEAERLARAIRKLNMDWIQVSGLEYNPMASRYEIKCLYRRDKALTQWIELWIKRPRQWIDLLTQHDSGLEHP